MREAEGGVPWQPVARQLAEGITDPDSRWRTPVAEVPRHPLVPNWWERDGDVWVRRHGPEDPEGWVRVAHSDLSLVTSVGGRHADVAAADEHPEGRPTSSATHPSLVVGMLRHARVQDGMSVLDLGTGAGGLAAYLTWRLGPGCVTSLDVDPYLIEAARANLAKLPLVGVPQFLVADATEHVPGGPYDRIVSTVGLPAGAGLVPVLEALAVGGRLVTTLAGTELIVTGWKARSGDVTGIVERDMAGFMPARSGNDYPSTGPLAGIMRTAHEAEGEVSISPFPPIDLGQAYEVHSMLSLAAPGIEHAHESGKGKRGTTFLAHADGSWARAESFGTQAQVHQSGPRKLWAVLERIRRRQVIEGRLPILGARVVINGRTGSVQFGRGQWVATYHTT